MNKKGVSLVTVLLFMLVATIAATATFKWLTSEGSSSTSRMQQQEAYQSALAGIQEARSWMTYHGNDVGGLIQQYLLNGKKAVLLNSRLLHAMNSKQKFDVWLTGVDENNGLYKLKILSKGKARGAVYSEAAILNVSGLYQIALPVEEEKRKTIDFAYAYFGSTMRNHGNLKMSSILINGNWNGNPPEVDENLIVTGWTKPSGSDFTIKGNGCIGGSLYLQNRFTAKNLYVEDEVIFPGGSQGAPFTASNNAYFNGKVTQYDNGFNIGNMTAKGEVNTSQKISSANFTVNGDLCLLDGAQIKIGGSQCRGQSWCTPSYGAPFQVNGNVWIEGHDPIYTQGGDFHENYDKIILGNESSSKLYIADAHSYSDYQIMREQKTFKEDKDWNKVCIYPVTVTGGTAGCNEDNWTKWNDESYSPYVEIPNNHKNDMYYFYNVAPGITDVTFKNTTNSYWKIQKKTGPKIYGPWESAEVASYYVGNNIFKDNTTSTYNEYNYNDGSTKRSPYCKKRDGANPSDGRDASFRPECHVAPWFKSNGTLQSNIPLTKPIPCADTIKKYCDEVWTKKPGCDDSKYKVDDLLVTAYSKFKSYAQKGCAANIKQWDSELSSKMNECYEANKANESLAEANLYNGYLVVEVDVGNYPSVNGKSLDTPLNGKFIIIVKNKPQMDFDLPATANDQSFVMLYMKEGTSANANIRAKNQTTGVYNYFIYTKKDVGSSTITNYGQGPEIGMTSGGFLFNGATFNGSIYAVAENCAKVSAITTTQKMNFNAELLASLTQSRIICSASISEDQCGGIGAETPSTPTTPTEEDSNTDTKVTINGKDPYFISIAPQIGVSMETQYKSVEVDPQEQEALNPSVVIIPRIIYLPKDAKGKLLDYYSVVNLNGATETKAPSKVSCSGTLPVTGNLYYNGMYLDEGSYTCKYASKYGDVPFYVIVSEAIGNIPEVSFQGTDQELQLGGEVTVSVNIPRYSGPEIEFNIAVSNIPDGWEITAQPGVTARATSGGYKAYYKVRATASATEDRTMNVFKIRASEDAVNANVSFMLTTPLKNCNIGTPPVHIVHLKGHANILLESLSEFCREYTEYCHTMGYDAIVDNYNCSDLDESWVRATGNTCSELIMNESWKCKTTAEIGLEKTGATLPKHCEVIIPPEHNSIKTPTGGETYKLYGSVKRKKVKLTVDFNEAKDNSTQISLYDALAHETFTCTKDDGECTFKVYAGANIQLTHSEGPEDKGKFSHWSCVGSNCPKDESNSAANPYYIAIYGNHTITANYRLMDHCFYEDFTDFYAFCDGGENNSCIDTCATTLSKNSPCAVKNTKHAGSRWLTMYNNNKSYIKPTINTSAGYITANNSKNANNSSGRSSLVLSTVTAGEYGTMNALLQTRSLSKADGNDYLNSGLVIRSSGTDYLIVNVFGAPEGNGNKLKFRVCKGVEQSINNYNSGACDMVKNKGGSSPLAFSENDFVKVAMTIDDNDYLTVNATIDGNTWTGGLDIKKYNVSSGEHVFVGFGLADDAFKIYDIGWTSTSYSQDCWDMPSISCSFADNYDAGYIPLDEDVSPKVIISSWFSEKNCRAEHFYNGCDNLTSEAYECGKGEGTPGKLGRPLSGSIYHFTETGTHGYAVDQKPTKEAQIKVVCPGDQTSLDLAKEYYSCGQFIVGALDSCSEEFDFYNSSHSFLENEPTIFTAESGPVNLRGSTLHIDFNNGPGSKKTPLAMTLKLKSSNGMYSLPIQITQMEKNDIDIKTISNSDGFNPQEISAIVITSAEYIYIDKLHIRSTCPNKLKLHCNKVQMGLGGWYVDAFAEGNIEKCSYTSSNRSIESDIDTYDCKKGNHLLNYNFKQRIDMWDRSTPIFTFTATDKKGITDSCSIDGGDFPSIGITCDIPKESKIITEGDPAPSFIFSINTMLMNEAIYNVTLDDIEVKKNATARTNNEEKVSAETNDFKAGHTYKYTVTALGESCSETFLVGNKDKSKPEIKSCYVNSNGEFSSVIENKDKVSYKYTVSVTDKLGNVFSGDQGTTDKTSFNYTYLPNKLGTYVYMLKLLDANDNELSVCPSELSIESHLKATCSPNTTTESSTNNFQIVINANITNCEEPCKIIIKDSEGLEKDHYDNVEPTYTFWDISTTATKSYTLFVTDKYDKEVSCNLDIAFDIKSSSSSGGGGGGDVELTYNGDWKKFEPGEYNVTCTGNQWSGHLVCKCISNNWNDPNCNVIYDGKTIDIAPTANQGKQVDDGRTQCKNGNGGLLKVLTPLHCRHTW